MAMYFVKICFGSAKGPAMFAGHWDARGPGEAREAAVDAFLKPLPPEDITSPEIAAFEARCAEQRLAPYVAVTRRSTIK